MRRSRNMSAGKASALDDLTRRKETGIARATDYEVEELAAVYDEVDEATYAEISALKRRDAREFLVSDGLRGGGGSDDDDEEFDELEQEFAYEDEISLVGGPADRKRKRTRAVNPHARRAAPAAPAKPVRRVAPAFFNAADRAPARQPVETGDEKPVFDVNMLDQEFEEQLNSRKSSRKKKKAALSKLAGDMLFDAPEASNMNNEFHMPPPPPMDHVPVDLAPQTGVYDAPPPSLNPPKPAPEITPTPLPVASAKEDDLSDAQLLAAVDAATAEVAFKSEVIPAPVSKPSPTAKPPIQRPYAPPTSAPPANFARRDPVAANGPIARDCNGDFVMFWTDAHDVRVNGGEYLYLFGKAPVGTLDSGVYASVCVQVQGMDRKLYILPRMFKADREGRESGPPVKIIPDVYGEVKNRLLGQVQNHDMGIGGAAGAAARSASSNLPSTLQAKVVTRSSPFCDVDAPREPTDYLKVKIPYCKLNKLGPDSFGTTFTRVYGAKTSASEAFCLKRGFKGPGWVRVKDASPLRSRVTHAKHALFVSNPENVCIAEDFANREAPPLSMLCINTKTILSPKTGAHELVMIAGVFVKDVPLAGAAPEETYEPGGPLGTRDFVLVRSPDGRNIPFGFRDRANSVMAGGGIEVLPNEPAMLNNFLTKLLRLDPDVLLGHDLMGFGLDVLLARLNARKSRDWSRLGRMVQTKNLGYAVKNNTSSSWFKEEAVAGRLVVDTLATSKELLMREKDYSLLALSHNVLAGAVPPGPRAAARRAAVALQPGTDVTMVPTAFEAADSLCHLVSECRREARIAGKLAAHLNILPLTKQLTAISGNLWSRTLRGARAERIEYLLCHELRLIGSKKGGESAKAGNISSKLLLPDKLTKSERAKIEMQIQTRRNNLIKQDPNCKVEDDGRGGYGYGGDQTPSASAKKSKSARRKPQYSGGLVLEPKKGLYDRYVLQLDFNSLYPSIIQEFNICFTTMDLTKSSRPTTTRSSSATEEAEIDVTADGNKPLVAPGRSVLEGVLPRVLRRLIEQRRTVKKALKQERERNGESLRAQQLETRQLAIKLTANSLYGCLGFENSRFFARPLAELVTLQGRDTLQKTVDLARDSFNSEVIYGDTDSIFVHTGLDDIRAVRKVGTELKREVNKRYHTLEIEIDAIYKKILLLKKKKYAALKLINPANPDQVVREVKGLDLVRHDWCDLSHDASEHFLTQIFQSQATNIDDAVSNVLSFLTELTTKVNQNQVILSKYVITRCLTKKPEDYPEGKNLPHVQVAIRLRNTMKRRIQAGDYIKYVICIPASSAGKGADYTPVSGSIADRAYHPDEVVASEGKLVIDVKYYLEHQVLPPIIRLCDPIESIDRGRIASSLGLDGRRYERKENENDDGVMNERLGLGPAASEADKYVDVDPFMVPCNHCGAASEFKGLLFNKSGKAVRSSGLECGKCNHRLRLAAISNSMTNHVRNWLAKYYCTPHRVNGAETGERQRLTRNVALGGTGLLARRQWDEAWLYTQLRYLHFLMDVEGRWGHVSNKEEMRTPVSLIDLQTYKTLLDRVNRAFDANSFRFVDLADFLAPLGLA